MSQGGVNIQDSAERLTLNGGSPPMLGAAGMEAQTMDAGERRSRVTFIDRALAGEVLDPVAEAFEAVDAWHDAPSDLDLHQWLGMTEDEYKRFAEAPAAIVDILAERSR